MLEVFFYERSEEKTVSKKNLLEQIEVKNPCSQDWDEMTGNDEVRFCGHCNLNVNNLSAMTRRKALKIVRRSRGRICVRYVQNPVDKTPVFADRLYQITRRAGIAAGVLGASLSLSTLTYAQGEGIVVKKDVSSQNEVSQKEQSDKYKAESATAGITGTVTDTYGAVIPNVVITLINEKTNIKQSRISNGEGVYHFDSLPSGTYELKVEASYFKTKILTGVIIEGKTVKDIPLEVEGIAVTVGMLVVAEYQTPLLKAVANEDLQEVKMLIAYGEDPNKRDENYGKITPLFIAVENGNSEIAEILLNFGAKVNARDKNKQTPLMRLDEDSTPELARLLIKHGAKVDVTDKGGNTPLILAAENAGAEILQILIDYGADVKAKNKKGQTALLNAAFDDDLEKVKVLVQAGADVKVKNKEGESVLDLAADEEVIEFLLSHGAIVEEEN